MSFQKSLAAYLALAFAILATFVSAVSADDEPAEKKPAPAKAEADAADNTAPTDVAELIKQLENNRFSKRQQATQKLQEAGKAAIPALAEAAMGDGRETTIRAIEILKKHLQTGDDATKAEAKAALEKIAKGNNAQAARSAEQALNPKKNEPPPPPPGIQLRGVPGAQLQIQIQGAFGALNGNGRRVTMQNVNGVKTIDAQEANRKVKITDDPNNGIKMEVTETKDGKEETKKYEAKNADELKKNHPDAHKLYEEYSKPVGGIQIGVLPLQPGALPQFPGLEIPGMLNQDAQRRIAERLDKAQKLLDDATQTAKTLGDKSAEDVKKLLDQIDAAKKELDEAKGKLAPGK